MELQPFTVNDKTLFENYLNRQSHQLSCYSFENTWIWRQLFELKWVIINDRFCLFFQNKIGCFMYLPPLGGPDKKTAEACFKIMEGFNHNPDISRIENIEETDLGFFNKNNFRFYEKAKEYIVAQKDMAALSGGGFRHKRNLYNFFIKNSGGYLRDYEEKDNGVVLELYEEWMKERLSKNSEDIYKAMLEDSYKVFCEMLAGRKNLNIVAKVVECGREIKGFTCGFPVGSAIFCINFEIADLGIKGLAQFIFTEFAKTLGEYPEINIMDDSGIENIKQTKLSYHPVRTVSSFTALLGPVEKISRKFHRVGGIRNAL